MMIRTVLLFLLLSLPLKLMAEGTEQKATFAGGCFWCMDAEFKEVPGVTKVISGYTGGHTKNPTYEEVSSGTTGHVESIEITFDPAQTSYEKLLDIFWHNVDPTDETGQFCDKGSQYRAAIFYHNDEQKKLAEASKADARNLFGQDLVTLIEPAKTFYPAEDYHQDYASKNKLHYSMYRAGCGRDAQLKMLWNGKKNPLLNKM